jgi:hypothetical protein
LAAGRGYDRAFIIFLCSDIFKSAIQPIAIE